MKLTVESARFADCMKKIQPAVGVTKDKKEVTENSVRLTMTKNRKSRKVILEWQSVSMGKYSYSVRF